MSLIDDDKNSTSNILQANGVYILFGTLNIFFKDVNAIKYRVNNKRLTLNKTATNRLKILKSFSIQNELMKTPIKMNEWFNINSDPFTDFRISYQ